MPEITPVPLAELTTLRTGGLPSRMIDATTRDELVDVLTELWADDEPWLVVGGGSNLFVGDEPLDATVVRVNTAGITEVPSGRDGIVRLQIEAGHVWDELVAYTVERGLAGIEAMSGIPGTVGAAPIQNVGAYGQEIVQTLVEVELIDAPSGRVSTVSAAELGLGFRTSALKAHYGSVAAREAVILAVTLDLREVGTGEIEVRGDQLRTALGLTTGRSDGQPVTLAWIREHVLATRASKGMVLDPADPDTYSAGSFMQNAVVPAAFARTLPDACPRWPVTPDRDVITVIPLDRYVGLDPRQPQPESDVKVSSAWLIEQAGVRKGFRLPHSRAGVSTKHALSLTNRGGATAEEIAELARYIRSRVHAEFGLLLEPEPVLVGVEI